MSTRAWNAGDLAGADLANTIDDGTRRIREDLVDRLQQGGHKVASATPPAASASENNDGKHCVGVETQSNQNDQGYFTAVWDFAGTTPLIRQYGSTHATKASRTEIVGDLATLGSGALIVKGGKAVGALSRTVLYDAQSVATTYIKAVAYKVASFTGAPSRTLTKVRVVVGTRPVGSDLVVNIRQLAAPATSVNRFIDGSSSQIASVTLTAASGNYSAETTGLSVTLATDDELVVKYGTNGSTTPAADITILLQIE